MVSVAGCKSRPAESTDGNGIGILVVTQGRLRSFGCVGLLILIGCVLCLDLFHGLSLGQERVAYHPIYRFRQGFDCDAARQRARDHDRDVIDQMRERLGQSLCRPSGRTTANDATVLYEKNSAATVRQRLVEWKPYWKEAVPGVLPVGPLTCRKAPFTPAADSSGGISV
jgi:hypothetical protein